MLIPGLGVGGPETSLVCGDCFWPMMAWAQAHAPELIGPGWASGVDDFPDRDVEKTVVPEPPLVGCRLDADPVPDLLPGVVDAAGQPRGRVGESAGFGWEYRSAIITVSTMAGKIGSACLPLFAENHVMYTSIWWCRPLVPDGVPGPVLRGMVPPSSEERFSCAVGGPDVDRGDLGFDAGVRGGDERLGAPGRCTASPGR